MFFKLLKSDAIVFKSCGNSENTDTKCAHKKANVRTRPAPDPQITTF